MLNGEYAENRSRQDGEREHRLSRDLLLHVEKEHESQYHGWYEDIPSYDGDADSQVKGDSERIQHNARGK
jgi:hypothetical protein